MRKLMVLLLAALMLSGCAAPSVKPLAEDVTPRSAEPIVEQAEGYAVATNFAVQLFSNALEEGSENPVISPVSAYLCLAMVQNGAQTVTLKEFEHVMGGDTAQINQLCRSLAAGLTKTAGSTKLAIANSAWVDDDRAQIRKEYLQTIAHNFDAQIFSADLPSSSALRAINRWVNEKTQGLIPKLREQNYSEDTMLVLLNTLYFKAKWKEEFAGYRTSSRAFTTPDGTQVNVSFMNSSGNRLYILAEGVEGIRLPYDDEQHVFVALRSTDGRTARVLAMDLSGDKLSSLIGSATDTAVELSLPKFSVAYGIRLNDTLAHMGLSTLFDRSACDLTAMGSSLDGPLAVDEVQQKVKIEVHEKGTEAAAVTAASMSGGSAPAEAPIELCFDRPFVYAVVNIDSGVPLFMGILEDPANNS